MLKKLLLSFLLIPIAAGFFFVSQHFSNPKTMAGAPPYGEPETDAPDLDLFFGFKNWRRPEGPPKVALQVGHWKNDQLPEELEKLKVRTGSSGGGKDEWEVNLAIARATAQKLKQRRIEVDILPATIPPSYWADVFVAIHTDGSTDTSKSGFKIAAPWRDYTRRASDLVSLLEESYQVATELPKDPNITRNMRGYYAFSWWKYKHALHPMTTAVIIETGFLTHWADRKLLVDRPEVPARGIAEGVLDYLGKEGLW